MSRALILMYHLIDRPRSDKERRFCTTPTDFSRQLQYLADSGFTALSMAQLYDCMRGKQALPDKAVHITFDDGFSCVLEHAAPILQRHGFSATMFAVSDRLGSTNDWMTCRGFPERSILPANGLRELCKAGFTIGSHTRTHAHLTDISDNQVRDEILSSRMHLEDMLGMQVSHFAYPYGLVNETARNTVAEAGYLTACSTRSGFNRQGADLFLLRRIDVSGFDKMWHFRQKLRFGINQASLAFPILYFTKRLMARLSVQE